VFLLHRVTEAFERVDWTKLLKYRKEIGVNLGKLLVSVRSGIILVVQHSVSNVSLKASDSVEKSDRKVCTPLLAFDLAEDYPSINY
jgi:hypothetical protein